MISVLSGGTGTPKLLQGLVQVVDPREIAVIVNTAEDTWMSGLYISPDLDTVVYTLSGMVNEHTWYGIAGDSFRCHEMLRKIGHRELLRIGDQDRAIKLFRTLLLERGFKLSSATRVICRKLGVKSRVFPMSDDRVQTEILTPRGKIGFHEFWVARRGKDKVLSVRFHGVEKARPPPGVMECLRRSSKIIIGPSNPVTSIGPILRIKKIGDFLHKNRSRVLAVSPIIGRAPVSGPAGKLMRAVGVEVSSSGIAKLYRDYISTLLLDRNDEHQVREIRVLGVHPVLANLHMRSIGDKVKLAQTLLFS